VVLDTPSPLIVGVPLLGLEDSSYTTHVFQKGDANGHHKAESVAKIIILE